MTENGMNQSIQNINVVDHIAMKIFLDVAAVLDVSNASANVQ